MDTYIVLLRGINVGGKNILRMKELKVLLESNGFKDVKTYIQSSNIVLQSIRKPGNLISALIKAEYGFSAVMLALSLKEFDISVANNPYQKYEGKLYISTIVKTVQN
jgi:uncharacterized protein (DUF1697 family)